MFQVKINYQIKILNLKKKSFKSKIYRSSWIYFEQANNAIEKFILKAFEEKVNKLIVVTGKGIHSDVEKDPYVSKDLSILKYSVPEFINNNQNLMKVINDIQDATIEDGGSGAFYIFLKKNKSIK